ncbi:FAD-binding oxidoreductase [Rhodanobacter sp. KK11]|uniref:FAD-dependent oxidoreductase n=1 Tax=Rhodanobacter sp. KK11 TaxID=3083255 RepID=UPI00296774AB|nr:FAD-binding oxidoreductase [Rhodanobacter sp. KK11]MDW2981472.1 FAD-binding oxidoreductase [Rhodanobacter sp. KK11]
MKRRDLLKALLATPLLPGLLSGGRALAGTAAATSARLRLRPRPGDPGWPSAAEWDRLKREVGGRLLKLESPFAGCGTRPVSTACDEALKHLDNPFYLGDQPALTQTSGWVDAWTSQPSVYAVAAESTADVVAAVNFAREHHLRLVVKGGGHSYQGTSDAPDSLLVWTRHMNDVTLHDAFVGQGCMGTQAPQPAVSIGAGAMWIDAYDAVTTRGGRYVQGGGCTTVGVAGLVQSGGFGSFSKNYGMAAAGLLEAEVVTADGQVRIANACTHPDLFWAIKGGGGGSLGVVTRLTLRTRQLPEFFGGVSGSIEAASDAAYHALIAKLIAFYRDALFNPHWGEQIRFGSDNTVHIDMVFQGLSQPQAEQVWAPLLDWVRARREYALVKPVQVLALPARHMWDAEFFRQHAPGIQVDDNRPGAPRNHVLWAGDQGQVGWFIHGFKSAWLPASLLQKRRQTCLADALFACTRHWPVGLHFNKGLAGAPEAELAAARDTATNPQVLDAFALAIIAGDGPPAFPGMPGPKPDLARARDRAASMGRAMDALRRVAPDAGSYVSESDYFERDWQRAFWGTNYPRLAAVKQKYDPAGLFFVHHGVGSEAWSADGFTRVASG